MKYFTWFRHTLAVAVIAAFCGQAFAVNVPITTWAFEVNTPPDLTDSMLSPLAAADVGTGTAIGFHANAVTDWTTPAGNGSANSFSAVAWGVGDYWQFHTSTTGITNDAFGLIFDQVSSNTGPRDFQLSYSLNGTSYTNFGSQYSVRANASPAWNSNSSIDLDTFEVDLTSLSGALSNQANVYFRLTQNSTTSANGGVVAATGASRFDNFSLVRDFVPPEPPLPPELPIAGDLVLGLGLGTASATVELLRGDPVMNDGEKAGSPWTTTSFIRSVEFDNKNGTLHNVQGNLLALDEGTTTNGGTVYSFATQGNPATFPAGQAIGNTRATPNNIGQAGNLTLTRMSGLSVAPNNSKVALAGMDSGKVVVYDYTAGDSLGAGASASGGRETAQILDPFVLDSDPGTPGNQSLTYRYGTTWLDDNTVLAFNRNGQLHSVNATTMATELEATVGVPLIGDEHTALAYNPDVSPYLYAMYSGFNTASDPQSRSRLFIFNASTFSLLSQTDLDVLDTEGHTAREMALDADGNLFIGTFESQVYFIPDVVTNPASVAAPVTWYSGGIFSAHTGLDIGFAPPAEDDADYNEDGIIDAADIVAWRKLQALFGGAAGRLLWRQQFAQASPGSGGGPGAVPEPAGITMLAIGLAALCFRRRGA